MKVGPQNPFKTKQQQAPKNMLSGYVEPAHFDHFQFENQRRTFHSFGMVITGDVASIYCIHSVIISITYSWFYIATH